MTDRTLALLLPDEPVPVQFMNTIWADPSGVHDDLRGPADLARWMTDVVHRDVGAPTSSEFAEARRVRDAMRRLAALATGDTRAGAQSAVETVDEAVAVVNDALAWRPGPRLALTNGYVHAEQASSASPTRTALAEITEAAVALVALGSDETRLRACHAPGCVLYFVKTHPRREWCSEGCGNRARAARHYRRVRADRQR